MDSLEKYEQLHSVGVMLYCKGREQYVGEAEDSDGGSDGGANHDEVESSVTGQCCVSTLGTVSSR